MLEAEVQAHGKAQLGVFGGFDHTDAFVEVQRKGLFRKQVSAAFKDPHHVLVPVHGGRGQHHEIGLQVLQRLAYVLVAGLGLGLVHGLRPFQVGAVQVHVADGL